MATTAARPTTAARWTIAAIASARTSTRCSVPARSAETRRAPARAPIPARTPAARRIPAPTTNLTAAARPAETCRSSAAEVEADLAGRLVGLKDMLFGSGKSRIEKLTKRVTNQYAQAVDRYGAMEDL